MLRSTLRSSCCQSRRRTCPPLFGCPIIHHVGVRPASSPAPAPTSTSTSSPLMKWVRYLRSSSCPHKNSSLHSPLPAPHTSRLDASSWGYGYLLLGFESCHPPHQHAAAPTITQVSSSHAGAGAEAQLRAHGALVDDVELRPSQDAVSNAHPPKRHTRKIPPPPSPFARIFATSTLPPSWPVPCRVSMSSAYSPTGRLHTLAVPPSAMCLLPPAACARSDAG